jgi:meso-butanediol dehydrogenase/(S,S)-butanediol dehydrogenase/diacetyl reductase
MSWDFKKGGINMTGRLENKVTLITGTARGMGRAAALLFVKEGAKVIGCDVDAEGSKETVRMVRAAGGEMISREPVDLSNANQVTQLMNLIEDKYGRLDVLYNNASHPHFVPLAEMPWEDWEYTIKNELHLVFIVVKAAIPLMIKHGGGSIINVSSVSAIRGEANQGNFAHAAAKGGVLCLTSQLALELAPHGIRANVILPGLIRTPATKSIMENPEKSKRWLRQILLGRWGEAEDIAKAALFLASDDASYITGAQLIVDGGRSIWLD